MFLPKGFAALCTTIVGLPITVAAELDDGVAVLGAAARQGKDPIQGVIGIHVKAGGRFVDQLTKGEGARFNPKVDPGSRVTLLVDKAGAGADGQLALGVLGDYLLVARRPGDLYALGPYVARTLSARPPPKEAIVLEIPRGRARSAPCLREARARLKKAEERRPARSSRSGASPTAWSRSSPTRSTPAPPSRSTTPPSTRRSP